MKIKISTIEAGQKSASISLIDIEGAKLNDEENNEVRFTIAHEDGVFNLFYSEAEVKGNVRRTRPRENYNFRFVIAKCRFSKRRFEKLHGILVDNIDSFVALLREDYNHRDAMYLTLKTLLKL